MRKFICYTLLVFVSLFATGCSEDKKPKIDPNKKPPKSLIENRKADCTRLEHANDFPECYVRDGDALIGLNPDAPRATADHIRAEWESLSKKTNFIYMPVSKYSDDRIQGALYCQDKTPEAQTRDLTCWARKTKTDGWYLLVYGLDTQESQDVPTKQIQDIWKAAKCKYYCTDNQLQKSGMLG